MYENTYPNKRYKHTASFLQTHLPKGTKILDLGVPNPFTPILKELGYNVQNTKGEDLDFNIEAVTNNQVDAVTAFEIFEHLLNPFSVLQNIKATKLVASVPLRLWFSAAYKSKTDMWDRHYHEFEDWQFDWLLEKTGWQIMAREKWTNPTKKIGFRPLLRNFTPRYYIVYAERV
ncbi:methyltransferase [Bizionia sediminis]|uniref:Methyltransferase n=1 Tax=Bizionia sediminis TaxID=1737064 RepID=A0ABW5KVE1_9FLAO